MTNKCLSLSRHSELQNTHAYIYIIMTNFLKIEEYSNSPLARIIIYHINKNILMVKWLTTPNKCSKSRRHSDTILRSYYPLPPPEHILWTICYTFLAYVELSYGPSVCWKYFQAIWLIVRRSPKTGRKLFMR